MCAPQVGTAFGPSLGTRPERRCSSVPCLLPSGRALEVTRSNGRVSNPVRRTPLRLYKTPMRLKRFAASGQSRNTGLFSGMAALIGLTALSACSGSASSEFSGDLFVRSCSIGCSDGSDGREVTCGVVNVTENQEISILFSLPVDPASITPSSLQVTDTANGTSPEGLRFVDPLNPNRVVFRPSISFDNGGISFSFETNRTYEILVPGVNQGDSGPFIRSTEGNANQSRLRCSVETTEGIADIVPGNPIVTVTADRVTSYDANMMPLTTERVQITQDVNNPVTDISRFSEIYIGFNELMFLPTVADNGTGQSPFIKVRYDRDGSLATSGQDRFDLPGTYEFFVDQISLTTDLVFTPEGTIPSAGTDPINPSLLVVRIPSAVTDAAGNPVTTASGGGVLAAVPEFITFPEITIPDNGETFASNDSEDANATGAVWGDTFQSAGDPYLSLGISGGSGRLGELRVLTGETVILNTENQEFPLPGMLAEVDVIGNGSGMTYPRTITVTDGVFEFSKVILEPSSILKIEGANPARILSRGSCIVSPQALIDAAGESAPAHASMVAMPIAAGPPPAAGPSGGAGGIGGDRADFSSNMSIMNVGGIANDMNDRSGQPGVGVGGGSSTDGRGQGGAPFPVNLPTGSTASEPTLGDVGFNLVIDPLVPADGIQCMVQILSAPGSGGGYSRAGAQGAVTPIGDSVTEAPFGRPTAAPNTSGGGALSISPDRRLLAWENNDLLGGSGGGGGGNHPFGTRVFGQPLAPDPIVDPIDCLDVAPPFTLSMYERWRDHSGAAGGGGGGAVEVTAGRTIDLEGRIDVSGGDGGMPDGTIGPDGSYAIPGGGGSGGAVRLRARNFQITGNGRVVLNGGAGGVAPWSANAMGVEARGGAGSPGLVRIEDSDASNTFDIDFYASKLTPQEPASTAIDFLSFAPNFYSPSNVVERRPDSVSGATSCWIRPVGAFVSLNFIDDMGPDDPAAGWNMDVVRDNGSGGTFITRFRGGPNSWEGDFGNLLGYDLVGMETASPIVVRFQGARAEVADLDDPTVNVDRCDLNITDVQSPFVALGSLTPWVSHPADLNLVEPPTGGNYTINMIRYCVMFDRTDDGGDIPGRILSGRGVLGVDNVTIRAQPE